MRNARDSDVVETWYETRSKEASRRRNLDRDRMQKMNFRPHSFSS